MEGDYKLIKSKSQELRGRHLVILILCFIGCTHCVANNKLSWQIESKNFDNNVNFVSLNVYSISNSLFPLIFGYLVDYLGEGIMMISFLANVLLAQLVHMISLVKEDGSNEYIYVASIFFVISGEAFIIPLFIYVESWFNVNKRGKYANFIVASNSLGKLMKNLIITYLFYLQMNKNTMDQYESVKVTQDLVIFAAVVFTFCLGLILLFVDKKRRSFFNQKSRLVSVRQALTSLINKRFILLAVGSGLLQCSTYIFYEFHSGDFFLDYKYSTRLLYVLMTIVYLLSSLGSLSYLGNFIDKHGSRNSLMLLAGVFFLPGYLCLGLLTQWPQPALAPGLILLIVAIIFVGIGYALLCSSVYTAIPCLIKHTRGTGLGALIAIQNLINTIFNFIAQNNDTYDSVQANMSFNIYYYAFGASLIGFFLFILLEILEQNECCLLGPRNE